MTGIKPVTFDDLFYKGQRIIVLDKAQRLPFNFAINFPGKIYREFRTLGQAKSFIRAL